MIPGGLADGELRALLWLRCLPGLGDRRLAGLLGQHGSGEAVLALGRAELSPGFEERQLRPLEARVARALRLIEQEQVHVLAVHRPGYPSDLLELTDAPVLLFARGDPGLVGQWSVAVVGTRRPTEYGISVTEQLVSGLVRAGVVVWSGLARGIDSVAHRTALENGGATVAVLGSGIDVPYPREHAGLLEEIALSGLVLTEFPPGEPPLAYHFPQRNRIIARLAHGVLVVEARPDGGALITAEAGSSARPIMAVPGPIGRLTSMGPNRLIQEGAKLVVEVADILEEIGGQLNAEAARRRPSARRHWRPAASGQGPRAAGIGEAQAQLPLQPSAGSQAIGPVTARPPVGAVSAGGRHPDERSEAAAHGGVLAVLRAGETLHIDDITAGCTAGAGEALSELLQLELAGVVQQLPGQRFRLATRPVPARHQVRPPAPDGN